MAANTPLTNTTSLTPDTRSASAPISAESRRFLRHVTAATAFGGGLDGFDLGVISVVILHINHDLGLTAAM
ncbi:MFS transporter, partial [Cutibacterium acnes]